MEESPIQPAVRVTLEILASPDYVDNMSNALKDTLYLHPFFKATLTQGSTSYNLTPES